MNGIVSCNTQNKQQRLCPFKILQWPGSSSVCLQSQHLGGGGISVFEASLAYRTSFRTKEILHGFSFTCLPPQFCQQFQQRQVKLNRKITVFSLISTQEYYEYVHLRVPFHSRGNQLYFILLSLLGQGLSDELQFIGIQQKHK